MKCCDITAGKLNRKVVFQRATKTRKSGGGYSLNWRNLFSTWARVTPKEGTERTHAGKLQSVNFAIVIMRYTNDLKADDRMIFDGHDYQIRSIINIEERNQWLQVKVEKGVVT